MFHVGQKVVCVKMWTLIGGYGDEVGPVAGAIYTVRDIGTDLNPYYPNELHVRLAEIINPTRRYRGGVYEVAFKASRFRPIEEHKTNISIFTAMLTPKKVKVDA